MGLLRRKLPATDWAAQPPGNFLSDARLAEPETYLEYRRNQAPAFLFAPGDRERFQKYFARWDDQAATTPCHLAEEVAQGRIRYFERTTAEAGFPPDWHKNPFTGQKIDSDLHWSRIGDFDAGDIKIIWEPSRFGFAFAFVRAYWRTGDHRYADLFWQLVEDWRAHNPPQQGPNWKCGQETSFRVMAWCFGLYGFLDSEATSATRVAALAQMIAVSAERIEANLEHALSQRNNHGISEGVGLWTVGVLFPEMSAARRWKETGRRVLEEQGRDLIYDDGAFSQHSVNYHRLMLDDYLWALRLGEISKQAFSPGLKERVSKAGDFLYQIQDDESGRVPYYGQNDGALVLPLTNCDYQDFRPVIQATRYLAAGTRGYSRGAWDEELLWLYGERALSAPLAVEERVDFKADAGGYYTLRAASGFVFTRAASFRHRPAQADMLHADLWWRGQNIALDAGTFSYNAPAPWDDPLAHTAYHNTVTVDGRDQMQRTGKFMWLPWLHSRARYCKRSLRGHIAYWEGEHDGYERLDSPVSYRRGILRLGDEHWLIIDTLNSTDEHQYRLHWLLIDAPYDWDKGKKRLALHTPAGRYYAHMFALPSEATYSLARADEQTPRGWRAPYYNYREPALSLDGSARAKSISFYTLFSSSPCNVVVTETTIRAKIGEHHTLLHLETTGEQAQVKSVSISGEQEDKLDIA